MAGNDRFPGQEGVAKARSWLSFQEVTTPAHLKTRRVAVWTADGKHCLGIIQWNNAWRKYAFEPCFPTVFEEDCLRTISDLLVEMTAKHRDPRRMDRPDPDANWAQEDVLYRTPERAEPKNLPLMRQEATPDPRSLTARHTRRQGPRENPWGSYNENVPAPDGFDPTNPSDRTYKG